MNSTSSLLSLKRPLPFVYLFTLAEYDVLAPSSDQVSTSTSPGQMVSVISVKPSGLVLHDCPPGDFKIPIRLFHCDVFWDSGLKKKKSKLLSFHSVVLGLDQSIPGSCRFPV